MANINKIISTALLLCILCFAFSGCSGNAFENPTDETEAESTTQANTTCIVPSAVDSWEVSGIYNKGRLIALDDVEALSNLYDAVFLTINDDNTFVYYNTYGFSGEIAPTEEGGKSFYLNTTENFTYEFEKGKLVEKPYETDTKRVFVITLTDDSNTILFNEYEEGDAIPTVDDDTYVYVKTGEDSTFIENNKVAINTSSSSNSSSKSTTSAYTSPATTRSYSSSVTQKSSYATAGERNALQTALDYLRYSAFSYSGLIDQLEFEGYTTSEATYAVNNCGANWNEQAVLMAKSYLEYSSFSRQGLIEQLEYEGFTHSQAEYGVSVAY